jgi:hypothetical protein
MPVVCSGAAENLFSSKNVLQVLSAPEFLHGLGREQPEGLLQSSDIRDVPLARRSAA